MMESGGEVRRTEDTVTRINYAAGATDAQVWAVPGILTVTVILADNTTHTGTKRLGPEEIDLAELDRLNTLSRRLCRGETVDWTPTAGYTAGAPDCYAPFWPLPPFAFTLAALGQKRCCAADLAF